MKLNLISGLLIIVIGMVGCSPENVKEKKVSEQLQTNLNTDISTDVITTENENIELVEEQGSQDSDEIEQISYAERHPEVSPEIAEIFGLLQDYSKSNSDFFSFYSGKEDLFPITPQPQDDFIDFETIGKKKVIRVWTGEFNNDTNGTEIMLDGVMLSFNVVRNKEEALKKIEDDMEWTKAQEFDPSNSKSEFFREFATIFDAALVRTEKSTGRDLYSLYKSIPLSEGYQLQIKLRGSIYFFQENDYRILHCIDNILINPTLEA